MSYYMWNCLAGCLGHYRGSSGLTFLPPFCWHWHSPRKSNQEKSFSALLLKSSQWQLGLLSVISDLQWSSQCWSLGQNCLQRCKHLSLCLKFLRSSMPFIEREWRTEEQEPPGLSHGKFCVTLDNLRYVYGDTKVFHSFLPVFPSCSQVCIQTRCSFYLKQNHKYSRAFEALSLSPAG
jgi:hypothetical protein